MLRRKPKRPLLEMSPQEMEEEIRQCVAQARVFARQGDVSAMETMLERASLLAEKLQRHLPREQIDAIKRLGYRKGVEQLQKQIESLKAEGKEQEAQRLQQLVYSYQGELLSLEEPTTS